MKKILILVLVLIFHVSNSFAQDLYMVSKANINFTSDAPLEVIEASSNQCTGVLKISEGSFAFRVTVKSFEGFNSSLQKTHFNENYMESSKFPYAVFEGKIIEEINFYSPGTHSVRGKGSFTSHGEKQERIIKCKLTISPDKIIVKSDFSVLLDDHNIKIPSVVRQKIAEEILVHLELELVPKK